MHGIVNSKNLSLVSPTDGPNCLSVLDGWEGFRREINKHRMLQSTFIPLYMYLIRLFIFVVSWVPFVFDISTNKVCLLMLRLVFFS